MAKNRKQQYTSDNIRQLEGLEAIRQLPGMYIGNNSLYGLHHLIMEVFANSADEVLNGYGDLIQVFIEKDGAVTVTDNGRGIPVEWKNDSSMSALTQVLTQLHAGGKFAEGNAYASSGGLHGVGLKAVNAMSEYMRVTVRRSGLIFSQEFRDGGTPVTDVQIFNPGREKEPVGQINANTVFEWDKSGTAVSVKDGRRKLSIKPDKSMKSGTTITFLPNREWFDESLDWNGAPPWDYERIRTAFLQFSFLNSGLRIEFEDRRGKTVKHETFFSEKGLEDYIAYLNDGLHPLHPTIQFKNISEEYTNIVTEVAIQYTKDGEDTQLYSFVNGIPTPQGGTHVTGFLAGLTKAINRLSKTRASIKGEDLQLGLAAVVNVTIRDKKPQFSSQTKESLVTAEARGAVMSVTYNELSRLLEKNKKVVRAIAQQAEAAAKGREAAKKARSLVIRRSVLEGDDKTGLLEKLADVTPGKATKEETTLFLVEGDSAGGSARQARDRNYHAILPLRGKIINAEKANVLSVLSNNEVKSIVAAVGAGFGSDFNLKDMRYGKVAIFTDADVDGFHIRTLLYTLFWRHMRPLIDEGRLYVAEAPLYRVYNGKKEVYCYTEKERREAMKRLGSNATLQRYKGLGEMSPEQLRATTFAPGGERLVPVVIDDAHRVVVMTRMLMGSDSTQRKSWIMETWEQET